MAVGFTYLGACCMGANAAAGDAMEIAAEIRSGIRMNAIVREGNEKGKHREGVGVWWWVGGAARVVCGVLVDFERWDGEEKESVHRVLL